jgi:hypothetical protein
MNFQVSINDSTIEFTFTNEEGTFHAIYDKSDKTFEKLHYSIIELFFKKYEEIKELPNKEFLKCCQEGNLIFAKYLFFKYLIDLEYYDKENKSTCLCWAAYNGHCKASLLMVKFLIENGTNIEGKVL